jgi:RimJ/RimL family protein N-acetyltransferase
VGDVKRSDLVFDLQPTLTGGRLILRPLTADDYEALYAAASDPELWALHPNHDRWKPEVFRPYFDDGLASGGALIAIERATGQAIGWSRYTAEFAAPGEIEIGFTFLGRPWWGGGWNGEMKRLMLNHAFQYVDRVIFRIGEDNLRSRRAVEKIGARLDGRVQETTAAGKPSSNLYYVIDKPI